MIIRRKEKTSLILFKLHGK